MELTRDNWLRRKISRGIRGPLDLRLKIAFGLVIGMLLLGGGYLLLTVLDLQTEQESPAPIGLNQGNLHGQPTALKNLGALGTFGKWSKVEIVLTGPVSSASTNPNPFLIEVSVTFSGPGGRTLVTPAFYDGGHNGDEWKVRFSPDAVGTWSFLSSSSEPLLDGYSGSFNVNAPTICPPLLSNGLPNFSCVGRLEYVGGHHLKFADGGFWIKAGIDDPENFLGTPFGGWSSKKAVINYLSDRGVNSIYVMTNTIAPGDGDDTWPWLGSTSNQAKANSDRFNITKLGEWEDFFSYVQSKGITLHIVLDDDSAWHGYDHDLYYREMIARFGHHQALIWNVGEEANENYSNSQQIAYAGIIKNLDPFDHPVTVHRKTPWPFFGEPNFDLTSIQPGNGASNFTTVTLGNYNQMVTDHRASSVSAGRPIPIMIDETPRVTQVNAATRFKMRSGVLYPIFLAGGNYELHFLFGQLAIQDLAPMLNDMRIARQILETLPFHQMVPCNNLIASGVAYCYGKLGEAYAIYMPAGGSIKVNLSSLSGNAKVTWYQPQTGHCVMQTPVVGAGMRWFTAPFAGDALLRIGPYYSITSGSPPLTNAPYAMFLPLVAKAC